METRYLVRLRFVADGPRMEGGVDRPRHRPDRYTERVGLYSLTELTQLLSQVS